MFFGYDRERKFRFFFSLSLFREDNSGLPAYARNSRRARAPRHIFINQQINRSRYSRRIDVILRDTNIFVVEWEGFVRTNVFGMLYIASLKHACPPSYWRRTRALVTHNHHLDDVVTHPRVSRTPIIRDFHPFSSERAAPARDIFSIGQN
ncbi:hypothetical protein EVAR_48790_1 [Eumeta japonica]|uniref:Uncharacterized protein n=1 Tax=Eumeta variegata TaxID=151549 RepID=A0A4C1Y4K5_EUMVA|nr:hypothetical protein EVAR_48790_1 [Eumeta japonica]